MRPRTWTARRWRIKFAKIACAGCATYLTEAGTKRANELGWPNTYTLTKSLAESLIANTAPVLPIAMVRPAIVETSVAKPFCGLE